MLATALALPAKAQGVAHVGLGLIPGLGLEAGYVKPGSFFTVEGMLYVDGTPEFAGGQGNVQLALGLGGSVRALGVARALGGLENTPYDFDVGLRFGPGLFFATNQDRADKNRRFSLFLEPFLRLTTEPARRRVLYVEAGLQRPLIRGGLWLRL